jgi:HEAT repeat protein
MKVRRTALFHAGEAGLPVSQLRDVLRSAPEEEFRKHVVFVIANRKTTDAVDVLMDVVRNEPNAEVRKSAIFWLGQSKDPRVPPFLLSILDK